jgi:DNA (cytosine-5)-methyltransferase 1
LTEELSHVDLFAGIGGFTLGFERSGRFATSLMADSDYSAALAFKRNRPRARYWTTDLTTVTAQEILALIGMEPGELDVLTAGPPCQGLSKVGPRQLSDPRNALLAHTAELIGQLRPRIAIIENVPALGEAGAEALFDELAELLWKGGYGDLDPQQLEAWRFGVPQLRRRLVIMAVRDDFAPTISTRLPIGDASSRFTVGEFIEAAEAGQPIGPSGLSVEDAIGDLPSIPAGGGAEAMKYDRGPVSAYQLARRAGSEILFNHRSRKHSKAMLEKMALIAEGGRNQDLAENVRLRSAVGEYFSQAYGRLHRQGIAQTITTYFHNPGSGRFTHYSDLRALTVREAARFQSFDDSFMFIGGAEQQMRHVGNAVPVLMAEGIASRCAELLGVGASWDEDGAVAASTST